MVARRLITALFMALLVSGVFTYWLSKKFSKPQVVEVPKLKYVATSKALDAGEILNPGDLTLVEWPSGSPLDGSHVKPEELTGRTLLYPLAAGQPVLDTQLSAAGAGVGLSAKIPDGMRAISLRSDEVVGVAGFMLPGTHVDVLVTFHKDNSTEQVTSMVLQDVEILATGQKMQPDATGKAETANVVTLLVNPADAEKVVLASAQGSVHFVLRNGTDHAQVAGLNTMSQNDQPAAPKPARVRVVRKEPIVAAAKPYVVHTVNGDKQSAESFQ
jgi:pilus assembly protein CpaB